MTTLVDTSAMYALLDDDDLNHEAADETFRFVFQGEPLVTQCNYVVLESAAVVQRRFGPRRSRPPDRLLPLIRRLGRR
jgi:predicted nucleic acid-binding protein